MTSFFNKLIKKEFQLYQLTIEELIEIITQLYIVIASI